MGEVSASSKANEDRSSMGEVSASSKANEDRSSMGEVSASSKANEDRSSRKRSRRDDQMSWTKKAKHDLIAPFRHISVIEQAAIAKKFNLKLHSPIVISDVIDIR
jgi:hypothetical protein